MEAVATGVSLPDPPEPPDPPDPPSSLTILSISVSFVVEFSTSTDLDLKVSDLNLNNQIFKELPLSKDFGVMNQCRCLTTRYCSMQTFYHIHFSIWPWTANLSSFQTVVSLHLTCFTPSFAVVSYYDLTPSLTASSSHRLSQPHAAVFWSFVAVLHLSMSPFCFPRPKETEVLLTLAAPDFGSPPLETPDLSYLTFQVCVLQVASQALECRAAGLVFINPSSLPLLYGQVMHLYFDSSIPLASSYFHKTYDGKSVAFMLLLTAVCSFFPSFTLDIVKKKIALISLWQIGLKNLNRLCAPQNLVDFSFMEFVFFPKFPLVSGGIVAGNLMSIATNASMFILFKGLAIRCVATSAFIAEAQCAVPFSGVGLLNVSDDPQDDFPLLSITDVECGGPLFIISVLSFRFVIIYAIYIFCLAIIAAALLYLSLNICSSVGE